MVDEGSGVLVGLVVDDVEGGEVRGREGGRRARRSGGYGLRGIQQEDVDDDDDAEERGEVGEDEEEEEERQEVLVQDAADEYNDTDAEGEDDE